MSYNNFSQHAPTGYSEKTIVSPNQYAAEGRNIGYPSRFSVYVRLISEPDGSQSIVESRTTTDLVGNRVYLYHRPLINANGTVSTITIGGGGSPVIDTTATNAKQGYIVFSTNPTSNFTISYTASPDCLTAWNFNVLEDDVMEIEKILGPTNLTGYPGLRNLAYGLFDSPANSTATNVAQRAVFLPHLDQNIRVSSSDDAALIATRGANHTIQLGRLTDNVIVDATGFTIQEGDATKTTRIKLGNRTGDFITYQGQLSGEGPMSIGGPLWPNYSGVFFTTGLTGSYYSGSMLRVHGDVAVMGRIKSHGAIEIITSTGISSVVFGDWTIRDELFVHGVTHLYGLLEANYATFHQNITPEGDIIAGNLVGNGGGGQTLVDNLDCSEVALTYASMSKKVFQYSVIDGPMTDIASGPKLSTYAPHYSISGSNLVGDIFTLTGRVNAPAGPSGAHPNIIQLNVNIPVVSGTYGTTGNHSGIWSPGMMDPGTLWIKMTAGASLGFSSPIYGYTIESGNATNILGINVFCPELIEPRPTTNDVALLYYPNAVPYNFITAQGGATPQFIVSGSNSQPLELAFSNELRVIKSATSLLSMQTTLNQSVSGQVGATQTGIAFIFADLSGTDPEAVPVFKAKPVPHRMPKQLLIGEITASLNGGTWTILDTVSYRPGGLYDSAWIPLATNYNTCSGRYIPNISKVFFQHHLGADIDLARTDLDLYLGTRSPITSPLNQTHTNQYSFFGQDLRTRFGLSGAIVKIPVTATRTTSATTARDATLFYLDGKVAGIDLSSLLFDAMPTGAAGGNTPSFTYLRLIMRREF